MNPAFELLLDTKFKPLTDVHNQSDRGIAAGVLEIVLKPENGYVTIVDVDGAKHMRLVVTVDSAIKFDRDGEPTTHGTFQIKFVNMLMIDYRLITLIREYLGSQFTGSKVYIHPGDGSLCLAVHAHQSSVKRADREKPLVFESPVLPGTQPTYLYPPACDKLTDLDRDHVTALVHGMLQVEPFIPSTTRIRLCGMTDDDADEGSSSSLSSSSANTNVFALEVKSAVDYEYPFLKWIWDQFGNGSFLQNMEFRAKEKFMRVKLFIRQ